MSTLEVIISKNIQNITPDEFHIFEVIIGYTVYLYCAVYCIGYYESFYVYVYTFLNFQFFRFFRTFILGKLD